MTLYGALSTTLKVHGLETSKCHTVSVFARILEFNSLSLNRLFDDPQPQHHQWSNVTTMTNPATILEIATVWLSLFRDTMRSLLVRCYDSSCVFFTCHYTIVLRTTYYSGGTELFAFLNLADKGAYRNISLQRKKGKDNFKASIRYCLSEEVIT